MRPLNYVLFLLVFLWASPGTSQTSPPQEPTQKQDEASSEATVEEEITVRGTVIRGLGLGEGATTASRTGLTLLELPASVDVLEADIIATRGHQTIAAAVETLPGVVSGESPAAPSTFSLRGFTRSQITFLRDGLWVGPTNMVMRPQNTFNLERIELLRGTAAAMHGQGSVAGVINAVTRRADRGDRAPLNVAASYGRFDTVEIGLGTGGPIAGTSWYRLDASHRQSDGFVERMDPSSTNLTGSVLFGASDSFDVRISGDFLDDELANYWGTPLVPESFAGNNAERGVIRTSTGETLDSRALRTNYNVTDGLAESDQLFLRASVDWQGQNLAVQSRLYRFDADRDWANAEGFIFNAATAQIDRTNGFFFVLHDQEQLGNRTQLTHRADIGGRENRLVAGVDLYDLDFERTRGFRFSAQPGDSVDFLNPVVGTYGPRELRGVSPTDIEMRALFVEDVLEITDSFSLHASVRAEWLDLVRENFGRTGAFEAGSSFTRDFNYVNWKVGGVYRGSDSWSLFGQVGSATDPVNANIFLVNAGENFDLTDADQWEVGFKGLWLGSRAETTVTLYDISRDDVLEQIGLDSASIVGGRDATGLELATSVSVSDQVRIGFNVSYTDAEFRPSANFVQNAGNQPPNVPDVVANLFVQMGEIAGLPLDAGFDVRHVDDRFGDNANTVTLESYTLLGAFVGYQWGPLRILGRVRNLTDEVYSPWADVFYLQQTDPSFPYANQVLLGAPRTWELSLRTRF